MPSDTPARPLRSVLARVALTCTALLWVSGCATISDPEAPRRSPEMTAYLAGPTAPGRGLPPDPAMLEGLRAAPDDPARWVELGRELRPRHRLDLAEEAFRAAFDLATERGLPRGRSLFELATTLHVAGDGAAAVATWERVTALGDADFTEDERDLRGRAHTRLAVAAALGGNHDTARRHRDRARAAGAQIPVGLARLLGEAPPTPTTARAATADDFTLRPAVTLDTEAEVQSVEFSVTAARAAGATGGDDEVLVSWLDVHPPPPRDTAAYWRVAYAVGTDGGASWSEKQVLRRPDPPEELRFSYEGDPMTVHDPRSGRFFLGGAAFAYNAGVYVADKTAGAATFTAPVFASPSGVDKPLMAAGAPPDAPDATRLYLAYLSSLGGTVQTSDDLGATWSPRMMLPGDPLGYVVRVGPEGEVYIASWDTEDGILLYRDFEGGRTWDEPVVVARRLDFWDTQDPSRIPGTFRQPPLTALAVDPTTGDLHVAWFDTSGVLPNGDRDLDLYLSSSSDRGATWTPARLVHGMPVAGDQFFPWIEADDAGRLHLLWYDTRNDPRPDAAGSASVEAYYAVSVDGGLTWAEAPVSEAPFESAPAVSYRSVGGTQFLGDYLGLGAVGDRAYVGFTTTAAGNADPRVRVVELPAVGSGPEICRPDPVTLCLLDGRFRLRVFWDDLGNGTTGRGRVFPVGTSENSGAFWFFDPANLEILVKVLDGRPVNDRFWVFAAPLTDVGHELVVEDLVTGARKVYACADGDVCPQTDTNAF